MAKLLNGSRGGGRRSELRRLVTHLDTRAVREWLRQVMRDRLRSRPLLPGALCLSAVCDVLEGRTAATITTATYSEHFIEAYKRGSLQLPGMREYRVSKALGPILDWCGLREGARNCREPLFDA